MQITVPMMEEKRAQLERQLEEVLAQANVISGALKEIDHWLGVLALEEGDKTPIVNMTGPEFVTALKLAETR
jgi:hypothetical protein